MNNFQYSEDVEVRSNSEEPWQMAKFIGMRGKEYVVRGDAEGFNVYPQCRKSENVNKEDARRNIHTSAGA